MAIGNKGKRCQKARLNIIICLVSICIMIASCSDGYPELGSGYKIVGEGGYTTSIVNSQNTQMISGYILDYSYDSNFIVVAQSPPDSLPKMKALYYSDNDKKKIAADEKIFRRYWIINKEMESIYSFDSVNRIANYSNVFGPYTKEKYLEKKDSLNTPKNLKLELE